MQQPQPLSLSDSQLSAVMAAAQPLNVHDRTPFLIALANRLRGEIIGDGAVARACRELQREFLRTMPRVGDDDIAPKRLKCGKYR